MNIYIQIVISVITLFLSAYLAYYFGIQSTRTKEKDEEKKKLRKLLFHLLIVRKTESDRLKMNKVKENMENQFIRFFRDEIGIPEELINDDSTSEIINSQWKIFENVIEKKNIIELVSSKQSINILIDEFSEINPLFALSLKNYANEEGKELLPNLFETHDKNLELDIMKDAMIPSFQIKMIEQIDDIINETTSKIDNKTQKEVQELLIEYDKVDIDKDDYENYMNEILINPLNEKLNNESIQS